MKFEVEEVDAADRENRIVRAWRSVDHALWRVEVYAVLFGCRVGVCHGPERFRGYELVYCCGLQPVALMTVPAVVMKGIGACEHRHPGDPRAARAEVLRDFPRQHVKPMYNDPACWARLCELAGVPELGHLLEINPKEP